MAGEKQNAEWKWLFAGLGHAELPKPVFSLGANVNGRFPGHGQHI